ncbi:peptidoglycan D,D-transpeptidase FtsI family protein [Brackiella oedipodis]|uniref:peptidoglycan D,D-transpeptidase FtsI family protein n=1 Tax=Brackiella oedipodis TaxID=124225 RepID=UPI00048B032B|nr:penicillin-binding protein 2 [Brackiella oedipodis]
MDNKKSFKHRPVGKSRNSYTRNSRPSPRAIHHSPNNRYSTPVLSQEYFAERSKWVFAILILAIIVLVGVAAFQQFSQSGFYRAEGEKRYEREITLPPVRGRIEDRNGQFLATSIPVSGVWMIPDEVAQASMSQLKTLSQQTGLKAVDIQKSVTKNQGKTFVYLKRQVPMANVEILKAAKIPGIYFSPEVKRIYPQGPLMSHIVGFTNIENLGIEGLEKQLNGSLNGTPGKRVVLRDRLGRVVQDVFNAEPAKDGENVKLTIDSQLQLIAYKAVEKAVKEHQAESGGAVVIDTTTGEILSMVSYPSYDPNDPFARKGKALRNTVITDTFEPGSIIKPLVAALALDSGAITRTQKFATGNGRYQYQGHTITDVSRWNGTLDVAGILRRSSNIGMTMISERLNSRQMWTVFQALGFGQRPDIGFPGAAPGRLRPWERWKLIEKATMSYGYGVSVSLLQIAHAYTALARDGDMISLSLIKNKQRPTSVQVYSPSVAIDVRNMLEAAAGATGTKIQAKVEGYRIGGKSGTARQIVNGAYSHSAFRGSFVGLAPISKPRIVVAATINRPTKAGYYGSLVAGPIVAEIIESSLKHLGIVPDAKTVPVLEASNPPTKGNRG